MCDRSFSDASRGIGIGVLPHIRDALAQARIAAKEDAFGNNTTSHSEQSQANSIKGDLTCAPLNKSLAIQLSLKEKQLLEMRAYIRDSLHMQKRLHSYLRSTSLDPAIGLEIDILSQRYAKYSQQAPIPSRSNIDELKEALTTSELAREILRGEVHQLRTQLNKVVDWNEQLEQERDLLHLNSVM